jgi:hypothetical protein
MMYFHNIADPDTYFTSHTKSKSRNLSLFFYERMIQNHPYVIFYEFNSSTECGILQYLGKYLLCDHASVYNGTMW